jgi:hypothetical protein
VLDTLLTHRKHWGDATESNCTNGQRKNREREKEKRGQARLRMAEPERQGDTTSGNGESVVEHTGLARLPLNTRGPERARETEQQAEENTRRDAERKGERKAEWERQSERQSKRAREIERDRERQGETQWAAIVIQLRNTMIERERETETNKEERATER